MRLLILTLMFAAAMSGAASAMKLQLAYPVTLHAGPERHYEPIGAAAVGEWIRILRDDPRWTRIAMDDGRRFFVATVDLMTVSAQPTLTSGCDFFYPYSGSNHYFYGGLTEARHSEPLGALLGYHRAYPC